MCGSISNSFQIEKETNVTEECAKLESSKSSYRSLNRTYSQYESPEIHLPKCPICSATHVVTVLEKCVKISPNFDWTCCTLIPLRHVFGHIRSVRWCKYSADPPRTAFCSLCSSHVRQCKCAAVTAVNTHVPPMFLDNLLHSGKITGQHIFPSNHVDLNIVHQ